MGTVDITTIHPPYHGNTTTNTIITFIKTRNSYECGDFMVTGLSRSRSLALLLRANGLSYKACAKVMGCSADNVRNRIEDLYYTLKVNSLPLLMATSIQQGFLTIVTRGLARGTTADTDDHEQTRNPTLLPLNGCHQ